MKVQQSEKPKFIPVHLILETQEEVDGIYAVLNHESLSNLLFGRDMVEKARRELAQHRTTRTTMLHNEICGNKF